MAKSSTLNVTQNIKNPGVSIANADGTTAKTLYTADADDAVVKAILLTSTDTAAQNVQIILNDGTTDRVLGTVPVAANAGTNGTVVGVDGLSGTWLPGLPLDQQGKRVLALAANQVLKVKSVAAVTATKTIDAVAVVEEY